MIDTNHEQALPLSVLARDIPNRDGKRGISVTTLWRWMQRGIRGIKLDSVLIGGIRMSSREALQRFFLATTAAADGTTPQINSSQRQRAIEQAERELAEAS